MQKIAPDVYIEHSYPGITVGAIITPEGPICIDAPSWPADARQWRLKLAQLSPRPVQFIINLDHCADRVLSNEWLEGPVIAHEITYDRMRMLPDQYKTGQLGSGSDPVLQHLASARLVLPQLTFTESLTLAKGQREIRLVHRPGPAAGAIWVELPGDGIVFVGEALTLEAPPSPQDFDPDKWLAQLAQLRRPKYPARIIIPGRGPATSKEAVKGMERFLKAADRMMQRIRQGEKTCAEAAAQLLEYFEVPLARREQCLNRLRTRLGGLCAADASASPTV
jgi:glyoxylase-like metal-dependent hydrolase (beta-lactamase superfamily II)